MGLFRKKVPEGISVVFYEGELKEFVCNFPCQLLLMDDCLRVTKINPYVEVRIARDRIFSIDILPETQYMAKYKGTAVETSKTNGIHKDYYIVSYAGKGGENKHLDFWGTSSETMKMMKMRRELTSNRKPVTYEI